MSPTARILVVEDDSAMGVLLDRGLSAEGYEVVVFENAVDALISAGDAVFDGAVVDVMLPGMSGFELCRRLRETGHSFPILLLTARDAVKDRVYGLDSGADDYLTKPFDFTELTARLRAMLRRRASGDRLHIAVGELVLDSETMRVTCGDMAIAVSPKEFTLLRLLASVEGENVSRQRILEHVWGSSEGFATNLVDQYVSYLRRKLDAEVTGVRILTVRGSGYRLEVVE